MAVADKSESEGGARTGANSLLLHYGEKTLARKHGN